MGQGVSPKEAAARAGLAAGVELLNASGMADEALGAAVKKSGLLDTLIELGRKIPGAKEMIQDVKDRTAAALHRLGMDLNKWNLTRDQETEAIKLVEAANDFTDEEVGMLAKTYAHNSELTEGKKSDSLKSNFQFFSDSQQAIPNVLDSLLNDGFVDKEKLTQNVNALEVVSIDQMANHLTKLGYDVSIQSASRSTSGAQKIVVSNSNHTMNVKQVQFSPGGGIHGPNAYIKFSTNGPGVLKVVFGDPKTYDYRGEDPEKIVFSGGVKDD